MDLHDLFPDAPRVDTAGRIRASAARIRGLRGQVGQDGLTPNAARTLIDEVTAALDACAQALTSSTGEQP